KWRGVDDLKAPRMMRLQDSGIVRHLRTWDGATQWHQDTSGSVHGYDSAFDHENAATDEWLAQRGYLKPNAAGAAFSTTKKQKDGGAEFDVVTVTPKGGRPVELWFDAKTHL